MRSVSAAPTLSTLSPPCSRCPSCGLSCARRAARHWSRCRTVKLSRRSAKRVEQSLCRNEISGSESLGEAAVDGRQQLACLARTPLSVPEPREAHCRPQLPGKRPLTSRHLDRLLEAGLGSFDGGRYSPQEKQLPFRAEQLCEIPSRFSLLRACQRLVDHHKPLGNQPGAAEAHRELGKEQTQQVIENWRGQPLEGRLEHVRARAMIPSLDEQDPFVALRPGLPDLQRMPGGEVARQSHVVAGGREITDQQHDRTRPEDQGVQK